MVNAQDWLDQNYPREGRELFTILSAYEEDLEGDLDLSDFVRLDSLQLQDNQLTSVNFLTSIPHPEKMIEIKISNNNIAPTDIACFSRFTNLKTLMIGSDNLSRIDADQFNRFYGSLQAWQNLTKLTFICLEATDVASGLEYLSLWFGWRFYCDSERKGAKCQTIRDQLKPYDYDVLAWQLAHWDLVLAAHPDLATNPQLKKEWLELITRILAHSQRKQADLAADTGSDHSKKIARLSEQIQQLTQAQHTIESLTDAEFSSAATSAQASANHSPANSPSPSRPHSPEPQSSSDSQNDSPLVKDKQSNFDVSQNHSNTSQIDQLKTELINQRTQLVNLVSKQEQLEKKLEQNKKKIEKLERELIKQEQLIQEHEEQIQQLKSEIIQLQQQLQTQLTQSKNQTEELNQELTDAQAQLISSQISLANAQQIINNLQKRLTTQEAKVQEIKIQEEKLTQKLNKVRADEIHTTNPSNWWIEHKELLLIGGCLIPLAILTIFRLRKKPKNN